MRFVGKAFRQLRKIGSDAKRRREFRHARRVLCGSGDLTPDRLRAYALETPLVDAEKGLVRRISLEVSSSDSMYRPGWAVSYLTAGISATRCIQASLHAAGKIVSKGAVLDFPCGYGRVLRFLKEMFPDSEMIGGDLEIAALNYCQRAFSVHGFLSKSDFRSLSLPRRFDLIWCGSLITHIDEWAAVDLLDFFHRHLLDGGICIFTTHGRHVAEMMDSKEMSFGLTEEGRKKILRDYQQKGYGYADYPSSSGGISVTSQSRVVELAKGVGSWEHAYCLENGWHALQDVHAFALRAPSLQRGGVV